MAGIFKKLSANDIKITPFEAHKKYSNTDLSSIGVSTDFVSWAPYNKAYFIDNNRKYYQIDKLYYRDYIRERAYRLELDDATYTTQERRLYDCANVISFPQRNFGNEIQPNTFILSCSYSSSEDQFDIRDDGFGNLYDNNKGRDNFPNEDHRILYIGPIQAFKRADLTIDYETGKKYVNDPFPKGYTRTVYDDSYFLNEVEYKNVNFVTSSNSGFYSIKTPASHSVQGEYTITNPEFTIDAADISIETAAGFAGALGGSTQLSSLIDNNLSTAAYISTAVNQRGGFVFDFGSDGKKLSRIKFKQGNSDFSLTWRVEVSTDGTTYTTDQEATFTDVTTMHTFDLNTVQVIKKLRLSQLADGAPVANRPQIFEIDFFEEVSTPKPMPEEDKSVITIPHQPQFNFETDEDFTINFFYNFEEQDHINSTIDGDYFILAKEGTKTVASLPSEKTRDVSLRITGSSQIKTAPIGNQFPYRIYYKGNHPNPNTASLFFERSDGENTQLVSSSAFLRSGSTDSYRFVACRTDEGELLITHNILKNGVINQFTTQNTQFQHPNSQLSKTVSNKANITLYNKPKPDGSYSNYIGLGCGKISQLMMWNQNLSLNELKQISSSIVGTPNIGNIFYDNGFAVVTHPSYKNLLNNYDFNGFNSVTSASISSSGKAVTFSRPGGGSFNNDGTKLILTSDNTDKTVEFTLDTPFDITSFTTSRSFDYGDNNTSLIFNNDGSKIYLNEDNTIKSFILSSSYDLGSKGDEKNITITSPNSDNLRSIAWSNDGTKFFTGTVNGDINQYTSKDPFDLDDILHDYTYNVGHIGDIQGIRFDNSGYKLFIVHTVSATPTDSVWTGDKSYITQYVLDRPFDLKSINISNRFISSASIYSYDSSNALNYPSEILFNNDGTKAYITTWQNSGGSYAQGGDSDYIWQFDLPQHVNRFEYKNTVLITENEYQCTMTEDEFEFTTNPTIRKIPFSDSEDIANFATGSHFKPYVTSVGLYDDDGNLLVLGKLGQPIKASSETDTTFVIRFDT